MADVPPSPAAASSPPTSPPTSPSPLPPRRPNKSRLRTLSAMDQMSTHSSNQSVHSLSPSEDTSSIAPNSSSDISLFPPPTAAAPPPPLKSNYRSRFTEHFDKQQQPKQRPDTLKASKSLTTIASVPKSSKLTRSSSSSSGSDFLFDARSDRQRIQLTSSTSTPLQLPHPPRKYGSNGSVLTTNTTTSSHHPAATNNTSLNRADFIISRLETWHQCLKSVTSWVEEVAKISLVSSRGFSQKAYPHVDQSLPEKVNASIRTIQAGFRALAMQMAAEQQAFSKCLERDHLPALFKLRRQVKDRVQQLKNDPTLVLDELLRRAEVTRSKMTHLSRCCKQADKVSGQQVEMDPWVANLLVLRQLKREVDEENRLRLLMIPIQKETADFEQQVIQQIKPTMRYCYQVLAPGGGGGAWDGSENKEDTASFELMMEHILPQQSWDQFVEENKTNIVSEKNPTKDYLKINYPNKFHPLVMTLLKGKMERKFGVRKQFVEKNYVLSQGGYLHQFSLDDKVTPEKTIYIPNTTIVPSIDLSQLHTVLTEYAGNTSNTFEICKPSTNVLQRDKISVFRTSTREELVTWCRLLVHIASGVSLSCLDQDLVLRNSSSSFDELEQQQQQHPVQIMRLSHSQHMDTRKISIGGSSISALSSPARSLRSVRTEESFNEPAAYSKSSSSTPPPTTTTTTFNIATPISDMIVEEEMYSTDAESFVTAIHHMDDDNNTYYHSEEEEEQEQDASALMDYFSPQLSHPFSNKDNDDDDAVSIASNSTAKGHSTKATDANNEERSPSLHSTSDAQSSLYFSSASAPPSPSGLSDTSSIVSIPEFQLVPQAIHVQQQQGGGGGEGETTKSSV